jgi:hypothetical protein
VQRDPPENRNRHACIGACSGSFLARSICRNQVRHGTHASDGISNGDSTWGAIPLGALVIAMAVGRCHWFSAPRFPGGLWGRLLQESRPFSALGLAAATWGRFGLRLAAGAGLGCGCRLLGRGGCGLRGREPLEGGPVGELKKSRCGGDCGDWGDCDHDSS